MAWVAVGAQALLREVSGERKKNKNKSVGACVMPLTVATFITMVDSLEQQLCL